MQKYAVLYAIYAEVYIYCIFCIYIMHSPLCWCWLGARPSGGCEPECGAAGFAADKCGTTVAALRPTVDLNVAASSWPSGWADVARNVTERDLGRTSPDVTESSRRAVMACIVTGLCGGGAGADQPPGPSPRRRGRQRRRPRQSPPPHPAGGGREVGALPFRGRRRPVLLWRPWRPPLSVYRCGEAVGAWWTAAGSSLLSLDCRRPRQRGRPERGS